MQNHYNLAYREEEREMIPYCVDSGVGCIPWSPLARGFLSGSRKKGEEKETTRSKSDPFADDYYFRDYDWPVLDRLLEVAGKLKVPPAQVALAWLLHKPGVTAPIIGCTKSKHLEDAIAALNKKLDNDQLNFLEELYKPHPILGNNVNTAQKKS